MKKTVSILLIVAFVVTSLFMATNSDRAFDKGVIVQVTTSAFSLAAIVGILFVYARAEKESDATFGRLLREHLSTLVLLMCVGFITGTIDLVSVFIAD